MDSSTYAPYGELLGTPTHETPFGFTGEQTDASSLVYLRSRYYDPERGVFLSLDLKEGIITQPMSLNGYAYVGGNPVNVLDPSGQDFWSDWGPVLFLAALGAIGGYLLLGPAGALLGGAAIARIGLLGALAGLTAGCASSPAPTFGPSHTREPNTAVPTMAPPMNTPLPTMTPIPTTTPHPSITPDSKGPSQFAYPSMTPQFSFRLPVDNAVVTFNGCNWIHSEKANLKSRDVNPRGIDGLPRPDPTEIYSPVDSAEVMIIDENAAKNGKFVAIRMNLDNHPDLAAQIGVSKGYLYIGYSHLSQINVSLGQIISTDTPIGITGQTGSAAVQGVHLDIMAFAITDWNRIYPDPSGVSTDNMPNPSLEVDAFFRLSTKGEDNARVWGEFLTAQEVDPLKIWPSMYSEAVCGSNTQN